MYSIVLKPPLPSKNRPGKRTRMTICIGMLAQDGIVIAADAEESDGYIKRSQQKIMTWQTTSSGGTHTPAGVVITGAGDAGFIDSFTHELTRGIGSVKGIAEFEDHLKQRLEHFYKAHVIAFSTVNPDFDFEMIVGVYFGFSTSLFVTYKSTVRSGFPYSAVGVGSAYALSMLTDVADYASVLRAELIAAHVISNTKATVPGCGKYTDIVTIHNAVKIENGGTVPMQLRHPDQVISRVPRQTLHRWEESFAQKWYPRQKALFKELVTGELTDTE
jgi:hypothetical protein